MRRNAVLLLTVSAVICAGSYIVRSATGERTTARVDPSAVAGLDRAPGTLDRAELARLIDAYEQRVALAPDVLELGFLARLYVERARLTGNIASYVQASTAATRAVRIAPNDHESRVRLAGIRSALHDFSGALELAHAVLEEQPGDLGAMAVVGDAQLELGDYAAATDAYGRLAAAAPGSSGVSVRLARLSFLRGDTAAAVRLAESAERRALSEGAFGPGLAWYRIFRSQVELDGGRYDLAANHAEAAVRAAPDYEVALYALARARAAQGRTTEAIQLFERLVAIAPDADHVGALADLYAASGDVTAAEERYRTIEATHTPGRVDRLTDRAIAVFLADHGRSPAEAVRLAESELRARRDIYAWDTYAWALRAAGRFAEARAASDHAVALGTRDAKLWYHAGMISAALGYAERARAELGRALAISPHFDPIHAPRARATLASLNAGA